MEEAFCADLLRMAGQESTGCFLQLKSGTEGELILEPRPGGPNAGLDSAAQAMRAAAVIADQKGLALDISAWLTKPGLGTGRYIRLAPAAAAEIARIDGPLPQILAAIRRQGQDCQAKSLTETICGSMR